MPLSARSAALNGASVVVGLIDGFLLLWTVTFMASAVVPAFARHYWWLGVLLSLISVGMVVVFALTVFAANEGHSESGLSAGNFRGVAAYLLVLVPLTVSAVASSLAWGITAGITGSIY
jgi:hypothetical protein